MIRVFIGGSRHIGKMNAEIARRLDNIVEKGHRVLVGDAKGFDRVVQDYLAERQYRNVLVYCTAGACRSNIGDWPVHAVEYHGKDRGREFYTAKDDAMLAEADFGFFAWDGKSKGTLRNIVKMAERHRPSTVYVSPNRRFITVRTPSDARSLVDGESSSADTIPSCTPVGESSSSLSVRDTLFVMNEPIAGGNAVGKGETRTVVAGQRTPPEGGGKSSKRRRKAG